MDSTHLNAATASAWAGSCSSASVTSSGNGLYQLTIPLDDCGTTVSQYDHTITFTNNVEGNSAAVEVDGIILSEQLGFTVSCEYSDHFDLDSVAHVEEGVHLIGEEASTGDLTAEFQLESFTDSAFSVLSSASNPVVVGQSVFNRVSVSGSIPSNIRYVVTDCVAQDDATTATASYDIIKDGCLDSLVSTTEITSDLSGSSATTVDFSFNGFTFSTGSDTVYLQCSIMLCAVENGDFVQSGCGFSYGGDSCAAYSAASTMGYSMATLVE